MPLAAIWSQGADSDRGLGLLLVAWACSFSFLVSAMRYDWYARNAINMVTERGSCHWSHSPGGKTQMIDDNEHPIQGKGGGDRMACP